MYCIYAPIIGNAVKKHLASDDTKHGYRNSITQLPQLVIRNKYNLTISNILRFDIIVKLNDNGQSFQQAFQSVRAERDLGERANYSGVTETTVRQNAQAMIAINLRLLQNLICDSRCWIFSIAFDATSNREVAYLDVRTRFVFCDGVSNVHFVAILLHDSHTGLLIFEVVGQVLGASFGDCWNINLIFVATDGASNMTRNAQSAVTQF